MNINKFKKLRDGDKVTFTNDWVDPQPGTIGTVNVAKKLRDGTVTRIDVTVDDGEPIRITIGDADYLV